MTIEENILDFIAQKNSAIVSLKTSIVTCRKKIKKLRKLIDFAYKIDCQNTIWECTNCSHEMGLEWAIPNKESEIKNMEYKIIENKRAIWDLLKNLRDERKRNKKVKK